MSLAVVHTRARLGIHAPPVTVEVHLSNGLPGLSIVGLPEAAVKESKDRVRSAIINSHFEFPARRITINLAPADLPKDGSRFDLAIAIGILAASEQLPSDLLSRFEFVGELALSGTLRGVYGILPAVIACSQSERSLIIADENSSEAALCDNASIFSGSHLLDICSHLQSRQPLDQVKFSTPNNELITPDFNEVRGQPHAKRGLEIAAAGGHNLILYGPPGSGKTMLANRLPGILPPLSHEQSLEVASIYSLCSIKPDCWGLPPFRSPHHTASAAAIVGGGGRPKPGEISLSHNGVLFLDELPEFQRHVLEVLREPLESGEIHISRVNAQLHFPAKFQLIAAMNPCPCGYLNNQPDSTQYCRCTQEQIQRYRQKISGPLLDRIDLQIRVSPLSIDDISYTQAHDNCGEPSAHIRQRVLKARERQMVRQACVNAQLSVKQLEEFCPLGQQQQQLLRQAMNKLTLSARAYHRIIKVARTIADLECQDVINNAHIAEALSLRSFDRD